MNNRIEFGRYNILPPIVKNLLIINGLFFLATIVFAQTRDIDLYRILGLHYVEAPNFKIWQIFTYMFMHGDLSHLLFNMFALWMFGSSLENIWGSKKFLFYYFVTGIGAAIVHYIVIYFQIAPDLALFNQFLDNPSLDTYKSLVTNFNETHKVLLQNGNDVSIKSFLIQNQYIFENNKETITELSIATAKLKDIFLNSFNIVGASGSVFGLLLAFGMLFPNALIYIYFLFPLKAKWFVIIYGVFELFLGVYGSNDGIGHFAHLGGMLFGIFLILYWKKKKNLY